MQSIIRYSALAISLAGAGSAMAQGGAAVPVETLLEPSTWVFVLAAAAMIGLAMGRGPSGTAKPLRLRRPAPLSRTSALPA